MNLALFNSEPFVTALKSFFENLNVPVNYIADEPAKPKDILGNKYHTNNHAQTLIDEVYLFGIINDDIFEGRQKKFSQDEIQNFKKDYDGVVILGITLKRESPTRTQLAEITRAFNSAFPYTPVTIVFKYGNCVAFANSERLKYKQTWREGEKIGKVSLLTDVDITNPHSGHLRILKSLSAESIKEYDHRNKLQSFKDLYTGWQKVFSTTVLNQSFYKEYQQLSVSIIKYVTKEYEIGKMQAHQGVLNFLNRIMFVYFVQKKDWLMNDKNFIFHYWQSYQNSKQEDTFHEHWLNTLFFKAFNNRFAEAHKSMKYLPENYIETLSNAPYLNGGLFHYYPETDNFILPDKYFHQIFNFFEGYIFTIKEDTPQELSLDINPELLGKMYEGMINATDLNDVDAEHGIVYTERPEISFMCRRAMVEVLYKKSSQKLTREFLYHFCFDNEDGKIEVLKKYKPDAKKLEEQIMSITACDPACGSGSMLLGVLTLQVQMIKSIWVHNGKTHTPTDDYKLKKKLISECIYGVDVKEWAVRIAELRLWLYMITEADFKTEHLQKEPLLPNLDFKLRKGNSLLPQFGDMHFSLKELFNGRKKSSGAIRQLNEFIKRKKAFIQNQSDSNTTYEKLKSEEHAVFVDYIREIITEKEQQIHNRSVQNSRQQSMFAEAVQQNIFEEEIQQLKDEIERLKLLRKKINENKKLPFSYELDFMEIFLINEENPGFDLVIGNPPYVRQEDILPPEDAEYLERLMKPNKKTEKAAVNKQFKQKLNLRVYETYPWLASKIRTEIDGKMKTINIYGDKVPGRADLYVYFQLLAPSLLNAGGTFCFIISNSWLDVGFGAFVQQFLLKHTDLYAVYDSNVRSFSASVNTIIYLHGAVKNLPKQKKAGEWKMAEPQKGITRFVMNKMDYLDAAYAPILVEQEHVSQNTFRDLYRVIVKTPQELYEGGYDGESKTYVGDKWGGKFLRAPEIYYTVLEKGKGKLVPLKTVADVRFGIKTGANDFFILSKQRAEELGIEEEYLVPILKSPKDCNEINLQKKHLPNLLFYVNKDKKDLKGTNALKYIEWGEKSEIIEEEETESFNTRPSTGGRKNWYSVGERRISDAVFPCGFGDSFKFYKNGKFFIDKRLYEIYFKGTGLTGSLNSSLTPMFLEIGTRTGLGDGLMDVTVYEAKEILVFDKSIPINILRPVKSIFSELGFDTTLPIREQQPNPLPDRKELDDIIFDELGLTKDERKEVYWATAELVQQRLNKASSR